MHWRRRGARAPPAGLFLLSRTPGVGLERDTKVNRNDINDSHDRLSQSVRLASLISVRNTAKDEGGKCNDDKEGIGTVH